MKPIASRSSSAARSRAFSPTTERVALGVADVNSSEYGVSVFEVAHLLRAELAARGAAGRQ